VRGLRWLAIVAAVGLAACGSSSSSAGGGVRVVAGLNVWGDIASQIGGDRVQVTSLLSDPGADPHVHDATAREAATLSRARLVIKNGLGYDAFLDDMIDSTSGHNRRVLTVGDVLDIHGNDANPHLWYDIPRIPEVARAIADELIAIDPAGRAEYEANLTRFTQSLTPLRAAIDDIRTTHHGAPIAYTERVAGYLVDAAGLTVASPPEFAEAIEEGDEPSARATHEMDELMNDRRVRALLYNTQATSPATAHVRDLAREHNIPVVAMSETLPKGPTYQEWQLHQLQDLAIALEQRS
jgi:zinc/manganese transport system substrate-binding protein